MVKKRLVACRAKRIGCCRAAKIALCRSSRKLHAFIRLLHERSDFSSRQCAVVDAYVVDRAGKKVGGVERTADAQRTISSGCERPGRRGASAFWG
jgi:hypothetical protein